MHLIYNGQTIREEDLRLPISNRAFQYNDAFFETVIVKDGKLRFWDAHLERIKDAAHTLNLELPDHLTKALADDTLLKLAEQNNALKYGRLKLKVWRSGAGLYTPETNLADWLVTVQPASPAASTPLRVGICKSVFTNLTSFSHFKGPNSLTYTLAALEKKQLGLDDMVLLSREGFVSEMTSSNIFWVNGNELFTPALKTGCINGILRRNILRWCAAQSIKVNEVLASPEQLLQADAAFTANVTGVRMIGKIESIELDTEHIFLNQIQRILLL